MFKRIITVTAITFLLIGLAVVPALAVLPIGQQAPSFQLNDLSGNVHKLSDYQGKVVVIDFFGDSCGACQQDAKNNLVPLFNSYYKNNANVQFLSVEVYGSSAAEIQSTYLTATGAIPWPILTNGQSISATYNVAGVPTLYVIDPAGKVAAVMQYPTDVQKLKATIDQYASSWSSWESLGGQLSSSTGPAVSSWAAGRLDVFVEGMDGALYHKWFDGGWHDWERFDGYLTASPAAASWGNGRIDVFARGGDGALYHKWFDSSRWHDWERLGGQLAPGTGPAVSSWAAGRLDVFVEGMDGALYHKWFDGGWHDWERFDGYLTASPAAASWGNGRIDVVVRGGDGAPWYKYYQSGSGWSGWESLGGQLLPNTGPGVSSWAAGRLDLFVAGTDNHLWHKSWQNSWSSWESLGGFLTSAPAAVSWGNGRIDVFARGGDGILYHKWQQNG